VSRGGAGVFQKKGPPRWFKTKTHLCNYLKSKALQKRPPGLSF